jgi:hypothetical protein
MAFRLAGLFLLVAFVTGCSSANSPYGVQGRLDDAPAMDSKRKIANQDCSKPVPLEEVGNLRCR